MREGCNSAKTPQAVEAEGLQPGAESTRPTSVGMTQDTPSIAAIVAACLLLSGCGYPIRPVSCLRIKTGEVLHGTARTDEHGALVGDYDLRDRNGIEGTIDASVSSQYVCKLDPSRKLYRNKCAVTSWPAGHEYACNDCDPCLLGRCPEAWCKTCCGDMWIGDRPCYGCDGSGFEPTPLSDDPSDEPRCAHGSYWFDGPCGSCEAGKYDPASGIEARSDETRNAAQPEGREPGGDSRDAQGEPA
jgi:hypothetical protein